MTPSQKLYELLNELSSDKKTAEFEYEGLFEIEGGIPCLSSNLTIYYKTKKLFTVERKEILNLDSRHLTTWLTQKLMASMNTDLFQLKSLEEDLHFLMFQKRLKDERKERNQQSEHYSKSLEKQVEKELKELSKKIAEKERRILDLRKYSPYVQAIFHLREKEKETTNVASQIGIG